MIRARAYRFPSLKSCHRAVLIATATSCIIASPALSESPNDYQCGKDEDVRRIEIRFEDETDQLPCRVIYRPETENESVGTVSWRGIATLEDCEAQAQQVVDRLTGEGWTCALIDGQTESGAEEFVEAEADDQEAVPDTETADQATGEPIENVEDEPAVLVENPDLSAPPPALATLINKDIDKLAIALDGKLEAEIVSYSDLNADDIADALVVLTYVSPQPAYRQFLAAYLFDGEAYRLTATRPIASSSTDTMNASIDDVDQGVIQVTLQAFEPGDGSCCPSGVRQLSLVLRELDLVEIDKSTPTR